MERNKIVIIVGAGAVENAWVPIVNAIKVVTNQNVDIDGANCFFARLIYLLRFYSKIPHADAESYLKISKENTTTLKNGICEEIKIAQSNGILKPRPEFRKILKKFAFNDSRNSVGMISTNWDTVVDDDLDDLLKTINSDGQTLKCFHIHGSIEFPEHLYLPSETTQENYRSDIENKKFGLNHAMTIQFLEQANQILIYGLSLDPLDAELSQVLGGAGFPNNQLQEIIIVNPDYEKIKNRIKILMFPRNNIKIRCFSPEDLETEK
ncbi:hypothetical protein [Flavobacterium sp. CF136]|uniref:hypothetical protein n=1 Tax=Flavobacterium sp. (strain CF136) TaxID=1144313 RepID=UPI000271855F|nr:hypothetical protein [Flavobacterium sp. CF136]EJL63952.1 hypothetical protein PMI10_02184 [Flavobacterium sp. CF136]